ncbi:DUF6578 domain-containing protein [Microbacterium sp. BWT-B31]|uniref:DUF6578 domain-containing protein n=1 Tax=Microbacterium sp. BWT-B31 TaxID=3232072 RepID=UPI003529D08A
MTRVWLTSWEWGCCGDAFTVGDDVDFGIRTRSPASQLAETLGSALVATVDAIESHHEEEFADRVRGRVTAVHAVSREVVERRSLRRPGNGAPPDASMPADGEEWPMTGRDLGNGVFVGSRPTRYMIEIVPVPDSAVLQPVLGVRLPATHEHQPPPAAVDLTADPPSERRSRSLAGWLVDVDEP